MKITIDRLNSDTYMEAKNEYGNTVYLDGAKENAQGARPMQLLLMAVGSCSAIDIIGILKKQKQPLKDLKIDVNGEREKMGTYSLFRKIHVHYKFYGNLDANKVERAINLSLDKYCSASKTLEHTAEITHSYSINKVEKGRSPN
ncbi:MAG TPA: OsmC family protein [Balneolales bacterium]|nr:OsmC family protein [Balneolales bacterium]